MLIDDYLKLPDADIFYIVSVKVRDSDLLLDYDFVEPAYDRNENLVGYLCHDEENVIFHSKEYVECVRIVT